LAVDVGSRQPITRALIRVGCRPVITTHSTPLASPSIPTCHPAGQQKGTTVRTSLLRRSASAGVIAVAALALAACSQSSSSTASSSAAATDAASTAAATDSASASAAAAPAPFSDGPVNIALVRQSGAGDYFTAWGAGAQKQADAAGINLTVYDAQADNAKQATDFETAINSKPAAIILDHGLGDTVKPLVAKAVAANIPVIVYDADVAPGAGIVLTSQSDESMAESVLGIMANDLGSGAQVGYVSAKGFAPLDRRAVVWDAAVAKNNWKVDFSTGKVSASTATDTAPLVTAALQKNPGVQGIFAAYDELAKGTLVAIQNAKLADKVKLYGIDISNADIELITAEGSPWVATAATDPYAVGAAVVRVAALQVAGQLGKDSVQFPAAAITQADLRAKNVTNMDTLRAAFPQLSLSDQVTAPWLPAVTN
jgi:simple sugar transport system substrate-binding protein